MTTEDATKLFVAGLADTVSEDSLRQLVEGVGGIVVSLSLPKDRLTGRPRGFGFVTLGSSDQAMRVREALDGSLQAGRSISVKPFEAGPPRRDARAEVQAQGTGARSVYVGNLPYDVTQEEIQRLFEEQCGAPPQRVHLPLGPDGRLRGFGFVSLASEEQATTAVEKLADFSFRGRRLVVNLAHPKGERGAERPGRLDGGQDRPDRRTADRTDRTDRRVPWREPPATGREPPAPQAARDEFFEPAKPLEGRRARQEVKPKKAKEKRKGSEREGKKSRGGGSTWHAWADLDEDE